MRAKELRRIWKRIKIIDDHSKDLVGLCLQLGNTPSPHAQEKKLGEAVLAWLSRHRIKGDLQFITEQSVNAVAADAIDFPIHWR